MAFLHIRPTEAVDVHTVRLVRETRADGGLRVTSPELPGLLLSALDHTRILDGLESAIRWTARKKVPGEITQVDVHQDHADIVYRAA